MSDENKATKSTMFDIEPEEYRIHLGVIFQQVATSRFVKAQAVLDAMNRADTIGPVLDPTLWINAHTALDVQREIVEAYRTFQRRIDEITKEHGLEQELQAIVSS